MKVLYFKSQFLAEIKQILLSFQSRNLFSVLGNKKSSVQSNQAIPLAIFFLVFSVFPKPQRSGSGSKLRVIISEVFLLTL